MKMMKISVILSFLLFGIVSIMTSCESVDKSDEVANQFYEARKAKDYEKIISLLDNSALEATPKEGWIGHFDAINQAQGQILSYKRTGFYTNMRNSETTTDLSYTVTFENGVLYEKITFIKRGEGFKIIYYQYNSDKSKLE